MQEHWRVHGPPAYISAAIEIGHRPPAGHSGDEDDDLISDPDQLAAALGSFPGGSML